MKKEDVEVAQVPFPETTCECSCKSNEFTVEKFKELYSSVTAESISANFKSLSYISWSESWRLLLSADASANYEIIETDDGGFVWSDGDLHFIKTKVTAFGKTTKCFLPVTDNNHNPVKREAYTLGSKSVPAMNSRIVGDAVMRCLAKNVAIATGLGLCVYNDDIPTAEKELQEQASIPVCEECGKIILGTKTTSAESVAAGTMSAYGKKLCLTCAKKEKEKN
jgi:hypothetical protein